MRLPLLCLPAVAPLLAQEPSPLPIQVDVGLVNLAFIVRDAAGIPASSLTKDDVDIYEDGVKQEVRFFGKSADFPLRVGLIVDASGSQEKFSRRHKQDRETFLRQTLGPGD